MYTVLRSFPAGRPPAKITPRPRPPLSAASLAQNYRAVQASHGFVSARSLNPSIVHTRVSLVQLLGRTSGRGTYPHLLRNTSLNVVFRRTSAQAQISFRITVAGLNKRTLCLGPKRVRLNRGRGVTSATQILSQVISTIRVHTFGRSAIASFTRCTRIPIVGNLASCGRPARTIYSIFAVARRASGPFDRLAIIFIKSTAGIYASATRVMAVLNNAFVRTHPRRCKVGTR